MLGGGTFISQNKILPGFYCNVIGLKKATANISERGYVAIPLELDWGDDTNVITITNSDFIKNSLKITGHSYDSNELKPIREIFKHSHTIYTYRLNGDGTKAKALIESEDVGSVELASAKYKGIGGNKLILVISTNVDDESKYDVTLYFNGEKVDEQTVTSMSELVDNDYANYNKDATIQLTAGITFSGGTNGTVTASSHQTALDKLESYSFNSLGCPSEEDTIKALYLAYTKRMRDEVGSKFHTIIYNNASDYEGAINVKNTPIDETEKQYAMIYWVTGADAGCAINASLLNILYDGEYVFNTNYTQIQLEDCIKNGEFVFHKVGNDTRVLSDINSLVNTTDTKTDDFKENQTMRVLDSIANDFAIIFNTEYLGKVPNDMAGRISLSDKYLTYIRKLENLRAIESFDKDNLSVEKGDGKKVVVVNVEGLNIVNCMAQCYTTIIMV